MAAISEILTGAFRRAGLLAYGEILSAADAQAALSLLNDMMTGLGADGIDVQWAVLNSASGEFALADAHIEGVKAMLAQKIAQDHAVAPSPAVSGDAVSGRARLAADYRLHDEMRADSALLNMPSQRL